MPTSTPVYQIHQMSGRPRKTLKQRIVDIMLKNKDFVQLNELYHRLKMKSHIQKAEVRGILNRSVLDEEGVFLRGQSRKGLYKVV